MALLDVTELLLDPDCVSTFDLERRTEYVGSNGRATIAFERFPDLVGSIQPISGKTLELFPDLARASDQIEIYTMSRLLVATYRTAGDMIVWQSRRYTVLAVRDFTNYGAGFVVAIAALRDLTQADRP